MDTIAHGLWTFILYRTLSKKIKKNFNIKYSVFWGMFPDIISFTPLFMWIFYSTVFGGVSLDDILSLREGKLVSGYGSIISIITSVLYKLSHSVIIFFLVFFLIFFVFKRVVFGLTGWLFHIFLDVLTHSYNFYATPFLWPISDWKFNGLAWNTPWFFVLNYFVIILVYFLLIKKSKTILKTNNEYNRS
jgi:hypothetical protein